MKKSSILTFCGYGFVVASLAAFLFYIYNGFTSWWLLGTGIVIELLAVAFFWWSIQVWLLEQTREFEKQFEEDIQHEVDDIEEP